MKHYKVILTEHALSDFEDIAHYIKSRKPSRP